MEGTDVFPCPSVCLMSSSHTGAVCGRFWGCCCWMQDLFFEKAFTASSHEQEQLVLDPFGAFPAGTAKVWLLCC